MITEDTFRSCQLAGFFYGNDRDKCDETEKTADGQSDGLGDHHKSPSAGQDGNRKSNGNNDHLGRERTP